jgi:outer membrane protein assembly factor BamB
MGLPELDKEEKMGSHRIQAAAFGMMVAFGMAACAAAEDWPQFLGPQSDGVVHDAKGLARAWPATGPKVLWDKPVGDGYGGAAIYGDSVLLLDREGNAGDVLRRYNLADGKEVWHFAYPAPGKIDHNGGRSTPATDGDMVFTIGPFGQINAVKFSDGNPVWNKNLLADWGAKQPAWAVSTSPLLYGDWVIVMPWGKKAALVAYEKATGNVAWTTPNPKGVDEEYQSPIPMKADGRDIILATGLQGYMIGVDAKTGEQLWSHQVWPLGRTWWDIPSPTLIGDGRIFMTGGYGKGAVMLKLARLTDGEKQQPENAGQQYKVTQLWANKNMGSKCAQALLCNGYLYGNSSDVGGGLRCVTLDGQVKWDSKVQFGLGNLIIADGLIYAIQGDNGALVMAEVSPDGYKELGRVPMLAPPEPWAPPAFKDGKLIVRDMHKIYCLDVTAAGNGKAEK